MKIIPAVRMEEGAFACYILETDTIYYDQNLDKFPELKEKILTHEKKHKENKYNLLYHTIKDIIDYPGIFFSKEFYLFQKSKKTPTLPKGKKWIYLVYPFYIITIGTYSIFILTVSKLLGLYWKVKK